MFCACAQSVAALTPMFAPLPANVAAMGNVSGNSSAQSALGAALAANAALAAATSASALAGANVAFSASALAGLTALANGVGSLQGGLGFPVAGAGVLPSLAQFTDSLGSTGLMNALGGLPLDTVSPLEALAKLAGAMSAAGALGVPLGAPNAAAQLNAAAQASASAAAQTSAAASGSGSSSASANAQMAANAAAFVGASMAVQGNFGIFLGAPGGVALLAAKLETLSANLPGLEALADALDPAVLKKALALMNALSTIKSSLGVNMLTAGAGYQVQPALQSLSKSGGPGALALKSPSFSASKSASQSKSVSEAAQQAASGGLGDLLTGLPVLPPAALLLAWLSGKLLGGLGLPLVANSACGPACVVPPLTCPYGPKDFAKELAAAGQKLKSAP